MGALPFGLLTVSTLISVLVLLDEPGQRAGVVLLAVVTAGWLAGYRLLRGWGGSAAKGIYLSGLAALTAGLVWLWPWFAFFAFVGYLNAIAMLAGWQRFVLIAVTAATISAAQVGGAQYIQGSTIIVYVVLVTVNTSLASVFGHYGDLTERQNEQRRRTIEELADTNEQLQNALAENAGLHVQLVTQAREAGVADERRRLAREIHDTLAQGLAAIVTQLEAASQGKPDDVCRRIDLAQTMARESLGEARRSVQALAPAGLDGARLPDALVALARGWQLRSGIAADVQVTGEPVPLNAECDVTLYRVTQEALANVAKHARAERAVVTLSYLDRAVTLDVVDDGSGFAVDALAASSVRDFDSGFGLEAMRQRVGAVDGELQIESSATGTAISVVLPVAQFQFDGTGRAAPARRTQAARP